MYLMLRPRINYDRRDLSLQNWFGGIGVIVILFSLLDVYGVMESGIHVYTV